MALWCHLKYIKIHIPLSSVFLLDVIDKSWVGFWSHSLCALCFVFVLPKKFICGSVCFHHKMHIFRLSVYNPAINQRLQNSDIL